jgi:hypothetical protein
MHNATQSHTCVSALGVPQTVDSNCSCNIETTSPLRHESDEVQLGHSTVHIYMSVINLTTLETTLAGTQ